MNSVSTDFVELGENVISQTVILSSSAEHIAYMCVAARSFILDCWVTPDAVVVLYLDGNWERYAWLVGSGRLALRIWYELGLLLLGWPFKMFNGDMDQISSTLGC